MDSSSTHTAGAKGPKKRSRKDDTKAASKRLRKDSYPKDGAAEGASPSHDATRNIEAHNVAPNAQQGDVARDTPEIDPVDSDAEYSIEADHQRWRKAALETQIRTSNLKLVYVKAISASKAVAREQARLPWLLLPEYIWDLHCLRPAQRVDRYEEMTRLAASLAGGQNPHADAEVWKLVHEASDSLKRGELEWYDSFQLNSGTEAVRVRQWERWRMALQGDDTPLRVTRAEIVEASQSRIAPAVGTLSQPPTMPLAGYDHSIARASTESETSSPDPTSPASIAAGSGTHTPMTGVSDQGQESLHKGQKRPISEDVETSEAKKARNDTIEEKEQRYNEYKRAIDAWCKMKQMSTKARWYEKLDAWESSGRSDVGSKPKAKAKAPPPPTPTSLVQTSGRDSQAEILNIRQKWKDLTPNLFKHPKDKAKAPEWPSEDSLANSYRRPDGMYNCMHVHGNFPCCREGLSEVRKKNSIRKQTQAFKKKVEDMIMKKELHVAHKTWPEWADKTLAAHYSGEMARIDTLLVAVQGQAKPVQAAAAPAAPKAVPQQHVPQPVSTPTPKAPRVQQQHAIQQETTVGLKQKESRKNSVPASPAVPVVAQNVLQDPSKQHQEPSLVASPRPKSRRNGQVTLQSMSQEEEERRQQQQAPSNSSTVDRQQTQVQLPPSVVVTDHVVEAEPAPTQMTTGLGLKPEHTSPPSLTPKMSSFTHILSPDRSSSTLSLPRDSSSSPPVSSQPERPGPPVKYQPVAMRMMQQLIKDKEPIVLSGLMITRDDVTKDLSGCVRRLTAALKSEAEEAAQRKAEELARSILEGSSQTEAGDGDENVFLNGGDVFDYLFDDEPGKDDSKIAPVFWNLNAMTEAAFAEDPSPIPESELLTQAQNEEDPLEYLNVPEAWYLEDPWEFAAGIPDEAWYNTPSTFTLDDMSYFDLDSMMPSDIQDTLRRIKEEREEKLAKEKQDQGDGS